MSDYTSKISELNGLTVGNTAAQIPVSLTLASGELATNKIEISQLRDLFDFDNAFSAVSDGIASTVPGQKFYVYVDQNKLSVNEYIRTDIGASAVIGKSGTKKIIYIPAILKHVQIQVESFEELRDFKPWFEGQVIYLKGYVVGSSLGSGKFVGYFGNEADDGGVTAAGNGYYWKRGISNCTVSPDMFGAIGDDKTNDDESFEKLFTFANANKESGLKINGNGLSYLLTNTLYIDAAKFSISNMRLNFSTVNPSTITSPKYALIFDSSNNSLAEVDRRNNVYSDIEIVGIGYRTASNFHAIKLAPTTSLANLVIDNFYIRDFNSGFVFGTNAYLLTFENIRIHRCYHGLLTTVDTNEETSLSNCGENIRFNNCVFDSLHKVVYFSLGAWEMRFNDCSFDFTGRTAVEKYVQFFLGGGGCLFNFIECHFESGNVNAGWYNYGFHCTGPANVNLVGGTIRLVSTTYNACPYFFFDESGAASFSIVDTSINGWGIQKWANTGLVRFRPRLKAKNSQFTLATTDDPIVTNSNFNAGYDIQALTLDTGVYTTRLVNDRVKIELSSITKNDGTVIPTFLITKLAGVNQFCAIDVFFKRPVRAPHNSSIHGNILFVPGVAQSSDRTISAVTGSCTKGITNNIGVVTGMRTTTTVNTPVVLSKDNQNWLSINTNWGCSHSNSYLEFDHDRIRLDLSAMALGDAIHLFNIQWFGAF